jgi:hypothetical protein
MTYKDTSTVSADGTVKSSFFILILSGTFVLAGCGPTHLWDAKSSDKQDLVGQIYRCAEGLELYGVADLTKQGKPIVFYEISYGFDAKTAQYKSSTKIPSGTVIKVLDVKYNKIPFDSSLVLLVTGDFNQLSKNAEIRIYMTSRLSIDGKNPAPLYFERL